MSSVYWSPIIIDGQALDLSHLDPWVLECPAPGDPALLRIHVRYSNHCFTAAFDAARHPPEHRIMDGARVRGFEPERYELSKHLPIILRDLPTAKVQQTWEERNYVYYVVLAETDGRPYCVFFRLKRESKGRGHHLELFVESAYPDSQIELHVARRQRSVRFAVLASKVYRGEPVKFAAR